MREIKFRSRRPGDDGWLYGDLIKSETKAYIITLVDDTGMWAKAEPRLLYAEVDPEMVGQYTGLKDKNGVEIYEGDIVRLSENRVHEGVLVKCLFVGWRVGFLYEFLTGNYKGKFTDMMDTWRKYEVIGNIHEAAK